MSSLILTILAGGLILLIVLLARNGVSLIDIVTIVGLILFLCWYIFIKQPGELNVFATFHEFL